MLSETSDNVVSKIRLKDEETNPPSKPEENSVKEVSPSTTDVVEEVKSVPKIRLSMENKVGEVKQFATAHGLLMHNKINKAKKISLTALHKVATWLTPKK